MTWYNDEMLQQIKSIKKQKGRRRRRQHEKLPSIFNSNIVDNKEKSLQLLTFLFLRIFHFAWEFNSFLTHFAFSSNHRKFDFLFIMIFHSQYIPSMKKRELDSCSFIEHTCSFCLFIRWKELKKMFPSVNKNYKIFTQNMHEWKRKVEKIINRCIYLMLPSSLAYEKFYTFPHSQF